jgi:hypothetical protein
MRQFYTYSLIVHAIIFVILYNTNIFNHLVHDSVFFSEKEETMEQQSIEDELIYELIDSQTREKEKRLNEVQEILEETVDDLSPKLLKTFSDLITSSDLDKEEIDNLTGEYLYKQRADQVNTLKVKLLNYIESSDSGLSVEATRLSTEDNSLIDSSSNTGPEDTTGDESSVLDINYTGSEIVHDMPEHSVVSEADPKLLKRELEKLKINETISAITDPYSALPAISHETWKYAVLPEDAYERTDTLERTQRTTFESLGIGIAPRMNKEFIPDGSLDEWELSQPLIPVNSDMYDDFSAEVYAAWDFDEIFVAAVIKDPHPVIDRGYEWWTTNSLELWFDALNNKRHRSFDSGCFQFWFIPREPYFGKSLGDHKYFARPTPYFVKITDDGYIIEAVFRTDEELRYVDGLLGRVIGFHFFANTSAKAEDGFEKRLFWVTDKYLPGNVHTYTWNNPNSWGDVVFTGSNADIYLSNKDFMGEFEYFGINELNRIVIQDADRNLDPESRQFVKAFARNKVSGDLEELIFVEIDNNSSKFAALIISESGPAFPHDGKIQTNSGEPVEIIYRDEYTPMGHSKLVKKTIHTYYPVVVLK